MRMNEIDYAGPAPIDGYGPGGFRIAGIWHHGAMIVGPEEVQPLALPLSAEGLAPVLRPGAFDVVLIGQGPEIAPLPAPLRALFDEAVIGVEVMATPSACRTYNVLLAEDRRVAAVLIPV